MSAQTFGGKGDGYTKDGGKGCICDGYSEYGKGNKGISFPGYIYEERSRDFDETCNASGLRLR